MEWTNEKHVKFLNSMEASFVQAMFAHGATANNNVQQDSSSHNDCLLPLDRFLPDSCDSTEDLPTQRRRRSFSTSRPSLDNVPDNKRSRVKEERKTRRLLGSQPYSLDQDQVVPQAELRIRE